MSEIDNKQLDDLEEKRANLSEVMKEHGSYHWGDALLDIYYTQIFHACRMEQKFLDKLKAELLTQDDVYQFLRSGGKKLTDVVQKHGGFLGVLTA